MIASNLVACLQDPTIQTDLASYQVLDLLHKLFATLSATACNIPQSSLLLTIITLPATNPSLLVSQTIQEAILTIYLNVTIQKWYSTCHFFLTNLIVAASSLTSFLQVLHSLTLSHYILLSSNKRPPTYRDTNQATKKTQRSKKESKANKGTAVLQPLETLYLKDIFRIKDEGNIKNPHIPVMKGIRNTKGAALCLPFLLGGHCDYTDPCGYQLKVNNPDRLPGTSNAEFALFHNSLAESK